MTVDPRLVSALSEQLRRRPGAPRVGWKLGVGDRERLGDTVVLGHLTAATVLDPGSTYRGGGEDLHADAEIAVEIGQDGEIGRYAPAIELVDLAGPDEADWAIVQNLFHRAVAFGPWTTERPGELEGAIVVDGEQRRANAAADVWERVEEARRVLESVGERLEPGDRVITGNIVQVKIAPGEHVEADLGPLGSVALKIA